MDAARERAPSTERRSGWRGVGGDEVEGSSISVADSDGESDEEGHIHVKDLKSETPPLENFALERGSPAYTPEDAGF